MPGSRSELRAEFGALITNEMTGEGKLLQSLFPYTVTDFKGQSPVMVLGSGGTDRKPFTFAGGQPDYLLDVYAFVLYAEMDEEGNLRQDTDGDPVWSEQDSEETLDLIEKQFGEFIFQKTTQRGQNWKSISYNAPTQVDIVPVGGAAYRREIYQLRFTYF